MTLVAAPTAIPATLGRSGVGRVMAVRTGVGNRKPTRGAVAAGGRVSAASGPLAKQQRTTPGTTPEPRS